jgi:hypothetical protein
MQEGVRWSKGGGAPMSVTVMSIDPIQSQLYPVPSAPGATAARRATAGVDAPGQFADAMAAHAAKEDVTPSADALAAVQVASQAYEVLRRTGRELRFESSNGSIRIEVYDGAGQLVRAIPPNEALALASGEVSWQA